ncbi:MAG: hypothetical protein HGB01_03880 [Chlorobiaceae bacterium]|nr:hypothetical protein [Chlorobiaceae bacterium]NTV25333.1 hypothetical protein [Chlorobiaceae bacterium]
MNRQCMSGLELSGSTSIKPLLITPKGSGDSKSGSSHPSDIKPGRPTSLPSGLHSFRSVDDRSGVTISK